MRHHNRRPRYCQCHLRSNPSAESLPQLRARVEKEILRLCAHFNCEPLECTYYCPPTSKRSRRGRRNPLQRWSRPLSAGVARAAMGEDYYPAEPPEAPVALPPAPVYAPNQQILLVGGDATYVPNWLQEFEIMQITEVGADLERQLGEFRPDLILIFVKADKPFRPSKHTIYKVHNYAKGDNIEQRQVPYITVHKGWSHVLQRAAELGLDWLREVYPWQTYIPEEELQEKAPREMTKGRSIVNIRRAAQFEAHGITFEDIEYAKTRYVTTDPSHCVLCGTKIKYQFRLMFDRPEKAEPTIFFPVGSVCIVDWVEAMPNTKKKLAFLKELKIELAKADEIKADTKKTSAATRRKEQSAKLKEREAERKIRLAEIKEKKRQDREARKQVRRGKKRPAPAPEEPLPERLLNKFGAAQQEFGWDETS